MTIWTVSGPEILVMSSLVPFAALVAFLVVVRFNPLFNKRQNNLLVAAVIVNILMILAMGTDFLLVGVKGDLWWLLRRVTSFMNFACSPVIPLLLYKIYNREKSGKWLYLPAFLNVLACAVSLFYNVVFFISTENTYARGPLFLLPFATSLFYVAVIFFKPSRHQLQGKRIERLLLLGIIGLLLLSMYIEITFKLYMLTWNSTAAGLIMYYLLLNIHSFARDPLTGAYNRIIYNNALESVAGSTPCTLALIDINDFKQVNDRFGHLAGDQCLVEFTELLNRCFQGCATIYRIGGDEFALLSKGHGREMFDFCLERARSEAQKKSVSFACGMTQYDGIGDIEESQRQIDKSMYKNKAELKQG